MKSTVKDQGKTGIHKSFWKRKVYNSKYSKVKGDINLPLSEILRLTGYL